MELIRDKWTSSDVIEFQNYLRSFARDDKIEWTTRIINTKMPVLAILSGDIKSIIKQLSKGNFIDFLNLNIMEYYENTAINGSLICKIKDFVTMKQYLTLYAESIDNWASCDLLKFNVKGKEEEFLALSREYITSYKPFVRRVGINILFKFITDDYIDVVLEILDSFQDEKEYYVNMVNAWLIAECFTKQRKKTLNFLKHNHLNDFTINKAVQKCRDSFRVSQEDKDMLVCFKRKSNK